MYVDDGTFKKCHNIQAFIRNRPGRFFEAKHLELLFPQSSIDEAVRLQFIYAADIAGDNYYVAN